MVQIVEEDALGGAVVARVGSVLDGKLRIVRLVGEGGMGSVYEAEHVVLRRSVAVKFLSPDLASDEGAVARFRREAEAAARIGQDNICEVFDFGADERGQPYFVMPLLRGASLAAVIQQTGPFPPRRALDVAKQVLAALAAAHVAGIVHRDLKPDNVFLTTVGDREDFVKVLDFGISKVMRAPTGMRDGNLTRTGSVLGTPNYMAPEQARGAKDVDHRVDIYAVGVILYEMLTAHRPFEGETFNEILWNIWNEPLAPPRAYRPEIPREVEELVLRAMSRDRDKRHPTAETLRREIAALEESRSSASSAPVATMATMQSPSALPTPVPAGPQTPFQAAWGPTPPDSGDEPQPPPAAVTPMGAVPEVATPSMGPSGADAMRFAPETMAPTPHAGTLAAYTETRYRRPVRPWFVAVASAGVAAALVTGFFLLRERDGATTQGAPPAAAPVATALAPAPAPAPQAALSVTPPTAAASQGFPPDAAPGPTPGASSEAVVDAGPVSPVGPTVEPDAAPTVVQLARIRLEGVPAGALVLVDGNPVPGPEFDVVPAPNKHVVVEVRADGYQPWRDTVVAEGPVTVPVRLRRGAAVGGSVSRRDAATTDGGSGARTWSSRRPRTQDARP